MCKSLKKYDAFGLIAVFRSDRQNGSLEYAVDGLKWPLIARSSHFGKAFQGQLSDSNENLEYKYVWVNIQCKWWVIFGCNLKFMSPGCFTHWVLVCFVANHYTIRTYFILVVSMFRLGLLIE